MPEIVPAKDLRPGYLLRQALFTRQGIKLLPANTKLSEALCNALHASGEPEFILAQNAAEVAQICSHALTPVGVESSRTGDGAKPQSSKQSTVPPRVAPSIRVGSASPDDIITPGGIFALERGQTVEEHHADALKGTDNAPPFSKPSPATPAPERAWAIRHQELGKVRVALHKTADSLVAEKSQRWEAIPRTVRTNIETVQVAGSDVPGWLDGAQLAQLRAERVQAVRAIYADLLRGLPQPVGISKDLIEELIALYARHPRRFAALALSVPRTPDYLPDQAYSTAALCVAIAIQLNWARWEVIQAGLAGLLSDCGMMLVPREIRAAQRKLDDVEINRVRRHCASSVLLLESITDLPEVVSLAAYQHHERDDASGYPLARAGSRIHPISKLVAVCDTFAGITSPRPHRAELTGQAAIEEIVTQASSGKFDRTYTRALVRVCGLFPISSWVRLSDDSIARVVGTHPEHIDRPIVQKYNAGKPGITVDLAQLQPWDLSVLEGIQPQFAAA
ncbi:MAG: hypothetical protein IBJ18_07210 [Phycisphaerales bacterium]|nr:hypothetical protein [Phycisphaerales bacterium]